MDLFQSFISLDERVLVFLHNTSSEALARKIMEEGFRFVNHLTYSCDQVSASDLVQLRYFTILRRSYGEYTIVLCVGKELVEEYSNHLRGTPFHFSEVLAYHPPVINEDGDPLFIMPPHFVKGYFNQQTGAGVLNPKFDPHKRIPDFDQNLRAMTGGK